VHIPKTAGVDLASHLQSRFPSFNTRWIDPAWPLEPQDLFLTLKFLALELACSDTLFVSGHTRLSTYRAWDLNGIRLTDQVFTVVRKPIDQILSQVNYVLTRIFDDATPVAPDTTGWRQMFGVSDLKLRESHPDILALAHRILRDQGVVA